MLALLRQAREAPATDWGIKLSSPAWLVSLPHLSEMRRLARLVDDAAQRAHAMGDDRLALELVRHQCVIAESLDAPPRMLLSHLVALSVRAMARERIEAISHALRIDVNAPSAARPEQVRQLIDRLLDEQMHRQIWARTWIGERLVTHDAAMAMIQGRASFSIIGGGHPLASGPDWLMSLLFKPLLQHDALLLLKVHTANVEAARQAATYPQYQQVYRQQVPEMKRVQRRPRLHPFSTVMLPGLEAAARTHFHSRVQQQMAGVALALRLYQIDHDGDRPDTLKQLVPDYLAAIPRDLFSSTDRPIGYKPQGVKPVVQQVRSAWPGSSASAASRSAQTPQRRFSILYSVGLNGQDDGGRVLMEPNGKLIRRPNDQQQADLFFLLGPEPELVQEESEVEAPSDGAGFKQPPPQP